MRRSPGAGREALTLLSQYGRGGRRLHEGPGREVAVAHVVPRADLERVERVRQEAGERLRRAAQDLGLPLLVGPAVVVVHGAVFQLVLERALEPLRRPVERDLGARDWATEWLKSTLEYELKYRAVNDYDGRSDEKWKTERLRR